MSFCLCVSMQALHYQGKSGENRRNQAIKHNCITNEFCGKRGAARLVSKQPIGGRRYSRALQSQQECRCQPAKFHGWVKVLIPRHYQQYETVICLLLFSKWPTNCYGYNRKPTEGYFPIKETLGYTAAAPVPCKTTVLGYSEFHVSFVNTISLSDKESRERICLQNSTSMLSVRQPKCCTNFSREVVAISDDLKWIPELCRVRVGTVGNRVLPKANRVGHLAWMYCTGFAGKSRP